MRVSIALLFVKVEILCIEKDVVLRQKSKLKEKGGKASYRLYVWYNMVW